MQSKVHGRKSGIPLLAGGSFFPRCMPREMEVPGFGWVVLWLVASAVPGGRAETGSSWSLPALGWAAVASRQLWSRASGASYAANVNSPWPFFCFICMCIVRRLYPLHNWKMSAFSPRGVFPFLYSYRLKIALWLMRGVFLCRYNTLPSRRTLKNSRLVSKKDDVHVCIMCLRAIMNYQVFPFLFFWTT